MWNPASTLSWAFAVMASPAWQGDSLLTLLAYLSWILLASIAIILHEGRRQKKSLAHWVAILLIIACACALAVMLTQHMVKSNGWNVSLRHGAGVVCSSTRSTAGIRRQVPRSGKGYSISCSMGVITIKAWSPCRVGRRECRATFSRRRRFGYSRCRGDWSVASSRKRAASTQACSMSSRNAVSITSSSSLRDTGRRASSAGYSTWKPELSTSTRDDGGVSLGA